jgi:hypothetical protein
MIAELSTARTGACAQLETTALMCNVLTSEQHRILVFRRHATGVHVTRVDDDRAWSTLRSIGNTKPDGTTVALDGPVESRPDRVPT